MEAVETDDASQTALIKLTPDPRRYKKASIGGKDHYIDEYLKVAIPLDEVERMLLDQLGEVPLSYSPPSVSSMEIYATVRKTALSEELSGAGYVQPAEKARHHRPLEIDKPRSLSFLSVDICGSTRARQKDPAVFERTLEIFFRESITTVGQFHGSILKTTGDGFLAYLDGPAFTTQCDNTVDLGLSLLALIREAVNPALINANLPALQVRIGADYGLARMNKIDIAAVGLSTSEVGSDALNRAVKIEQSAQPGEFRIGHALYELIHVQWLERCKKVNYEGSVVGIEGYPVYALR